MVINHIEDSIVLILFLKMEEIYVKSCVFLLRMFLLYIFVKNASIEFSNVVMWHVFVC